MFRVIGRFYLFIANYLATNCQPVMIEINQGL